MDIIKELIEIFNVSVDKSKVDEEVYMLQFLPEREKLYAEYDRTHYLSKKVIEDYKNGYIELIKKIINSFCCLIHIFNDICFSNIKFFMHK